MIRSAWLIPCVSSSQPALISALTCDSLRPPCDGGRPVSWMFSTPTHPRRLEHRQRVAVLGEVAVVERQNDRLARRQWHAVRPVRPKLIHRHCVPAGSLQRVHLGGELGFGDIEFRVRGARDGRVDDVVHQDGHRGRSRLAGGLARDCGAQGAGARGPRSRAARVARGRRALGAAGGGPAASGEQQR